jgi:hypothetical protein
LLSAKRIVDERRGHQVRQHFHISEVGKILVDLLGKLSAGILQFRIKLDHFRAERFRLHGRGGVGFERLDPGDRERTALLEFGEADPLQALQD